MYIVEPNQQIELMKEMTQLRRDTENCVVYFHHTMNDQMWKSFFPRATEDGLGPKLLRHDPLPESLEERIKICLDEEVRENAIGLGIDLSTEMDQWPRIIEILEQNRRALNARQIRLFLDHLQISSYEKNIQDLHINTDETGLNNKDFKKLLWRSRKLKFKSYFP
ncbi:MAG: hypothetical protein WEA58_04975 [Balneolaceae bacterium]